MSETSEDSVCSRPRDMTINRTTVIDWMSRCVYELGFDTYVLNFSVKLLDAYMDIKRRQDEYVEIVTCCSSCIFISAKFYHSGGIKMNKLLSIVPCKKEDIVHTEVDILFSTKFDLFKIHSNLEYTFIESLLVGIKLEKFDAWFFRKLTNYLLEICLLEIKTGFEKFIASLCVVYALFILFSHRCFELPIVQYIMSSFDRSVFMNHMSSMSLLIQGVYDAYDVYKQPFTVSLKYMDVWKGGVACIRTPKVVFV